MRFPNQTDVLLFQYQFHGVCILSVSVYIEGQLYAVVHECPDSQYPFSVSLTVNPRVSRYSPSAARFDFRT